MAFLYCNYWMETWTLLRCRKVHAFVSLNLAVFGSSFKLANVQFITLVKYVNECKSALTVKQVAKSLMGIIADVHLAFGFNV